MSQPPAVDILLLTYNRRQYLGELLDSILAQSYPHWRIVARDNGSADGTLDALREFQGRHPGRMEILDRPGGNVGIVAGFGDLLQSAAAPYRMFCDCDDVWLPHKIERTLACMQAAEHGLPAGAPVLAHTDLRVVDAELGNICESFWRYQRLDVRRGAALGRLLVQNHVTGCTVMVNAALAVLACPIPAEALMHDWWCALVAAAMGGVAYVDEPTILYRQHGGNAVGARAMSIGYAVGKMVRFYGRRELRAAIAATSRQAAKFGERFGERLPPRAAQAVRSYAEFGRASYLRRRGLMLRHGFWKHGLFRNIGWMLRA